MEVEQGRIQVEQAREGQIVGRPTLLAIFQQHLPPQDLMNRLREVGYPMEDVTIYYRLKGTDQVVDAITGEVAAGQSITTAEVSPAQLQSAETVLLMHPTEEYVNPIQGVLTAIGGADVKYSASTEAIGRPGGVARHEGPAV